LSAPIGYEAPAIAGSGTIACGIAACATAVGDVVLLARSDASAWKAEETAQALAEKVEGGNRSRVKVTTDLAGLESCDVIVEAIVEDPDTKTGLLRELAEASPGADLATTTSSLSIQGLGEVSGTSDRLFGLHVFNPPHKMELVELCVPGELREGIADRARQWCEALGKTVVEVPDTAGFVVNRLLFPFLFDAVRLLESSGLTAADVDTCMRLGSGHPMGPLALLDFVGLDVAIAIGDSLQAETENPDHRAPERLRELVDAGRLGRKSGGGFFDYD
jgi:3-hydroxybutyryl-CoA dehydrogenase